MSTGSIPENKWGWLIEFPPSEEYQGGSVFYRDPVGSEPKHTRELGEAKLFTSRAEAADTAWDLRGQIIDTEHRWSTPTVRAAVVNPRSGKIYGIGAVVGSRA